MPCCGTPFWGNELIESPESTLLLFAYHFPPENVIGAARPFRFYKYLSRQGVACHVITAVEQSGASDPNVEYVPDPFVTASGHGFGWNVERAVRKLFLPGATGTQWSRRACQAGMAFVRRHPAARITIFSTYPPMGTHMAAWQLARKTGLPWIADFRDPIADTPVPGSTALQRETLRRIERICLKTASLVLANTDTAVAKWQAMYPERKESIHLIWNGFDPEARVGPLPLPARNYKMFSHVGELYHGRNPTPLLEAFARLFDAGRLSPGSVHIRLVGPALADSLPGAEFLQRAQQQGWLEIQNDWIPQQEARHIAQTSDGLILVQPHTNVQVPGKLFEYLQIGRPILALVLPGSPIERILAHCGVPYCCVYAGSPAHEIDERVADFCRIPSDAIRPNAWFEKEFDGRHQAEILRALITCDTGPDAGLRD